MLDKAIPYLESALQQGEERAHYTLAFTCVMKGDQLKALPEFEACLKFDPENRIARKFAADINAGRLVVNVHEDAPGRASTPD